MKASLVTRNFVFKLKRTQKMSARVAFAFSRKTANAVVRNRFKRRIREILRLHVLTGVGCDVMCMARGSLTKISDIAWQNEKIKITNWCESLD